MQGLLHALTFLNVFCVDKTIHDIVLFLHSLLPQKDRKQDGIPERGQCGATPILGMRSHVTGFTGHRFGWGHHRSCQANLSCRHGAFFNKATCPYITRMVTHTIVQKIGNQRQPIGQSKRTRNKEGKKWSKEKRQEKWEATVESNISRQ